MKKAWEVRAWRGKTRWILSTLTAAALAACGGGGGDSGHAIPGLAASSALAQRCVALHFAHVQVLNLRYGNVLAVPPYYCINQALHPTHDVYA